MSSIPKLSKSPPRTSEARRAYNAAYYQSNKEKIKRKQQDAHAANPKRRLNNRLKSVFGITLEERDAMLSEQGGVCAICKASKPPTKLGWVVDHCHDTGRVRGILCSPCNTLLGAARDNTETLANAIQYLN